MRPEMVRDRLLGIAGEHLGLLAAADQLAEQAVGCRRGLEAAVEQRIGNAGLLLHPVGERHVGVGHVADVEDEIRLEREHGLDIGGVAAAGDPADLRAVADIGQQELPFLAPGWGASSRAASRARACTA